MSNVLLVDGSNLLYRAHLVPKNDMSVGDVDTGALVIFINTLARYTRIERPERAVICWDGGYSAYRRYVYSKYKADRKQKYDDEPQPPFDITQEFLRLAGYPQLQLPGYEGDDLIAAFWRACRGHQSITILSGDKDMMQMIESGTEQLRPGSASERPDRWDRVKFIKEKGYKPENVVSVMSLMGDKIDGIPGLPRVGPKTAIKMLTAFDWDLMKLIDSLPAEDQETVLRNAALVDLECVPLELEMPPAFLPVTPQDPRWGRLEQFLDRYQMTVVKNRLIKGDLWRDTTTAGRIHR